MVIGNLNPSVIRDDKGSLWGNFLLNERLKKNGYGHTLARMYFWRTKQQQEIDLVEEKSGVLTGYEFKWSENATHSISGTFSKIYSAEVKAIHRGNFRTFVK